MIKMSVDQASLQRLSAIVREMGGSITREASIAVNKVAKKVKLESARKLTQVLGLKVGFLKKAVKIKRLASPKDSSAELTLKEGYPIPLKYFSAKAIKTKKGGVSFRIMRAHKRRMVNRELFIIEKYKGPNSTLGHVFKRAGKERGPLIRMNGPAPGDVYREAGVLELAMRVANERLPIELKERIRFLTLKAAGKLRGKQKT